jgi:hypothetical protein
VLQISAVHRPKDSEIDAHGKGVGNCWKSAPLPFRQQSSPRQLV